MGKLPLHKCVKEDYNQCTCHTHTHTHTHTYIYIFTNLLSTSLHGYQEKRKKMPGTRDNNISNYRPGKKEKIP